MSQKNPQREGEKVKIYVLFSTWTHLGHQGRPMKLRGDFQEHFHLILMRSRDNFGSEKTKMTKQIKTKPSKKRSEKQGARATNDNFFHNKADCPSAVAGLGEALWIFIQYPLRGRGTPVLENKKESMFLSAEVSKFQSFEVSILQTYEISNFGITKLKNRKWYTHLQPFPALRSSDLRK